MKNFGKKKIMIAVSAVVVLAAACLIAFFSCREPAAAEPEGVYISELAYSSPFLVQKQSRGGYIELFNSNADAFSLDGCGFSVNKGEAVFPFPTGSSIGPGGSFIVLLETADSVSAGTGFSLNPAGGETLVFLRADGSRDTVITAPADAGKALLRDGKSLISGEQSPGYSNTSAGVSDWQAEYSTGYGAIRISEAMPDNTAVLMSPDGNFYDYIEIENFSDEPADLSGWILSDGGNFWSFPDFVLQPGNYVLISAVGQQLPFSELCADFRLSSEECLRLMNPYGFNISELELCGAEKNEAVCLLSDGSCAITKWPSPGAKNNEQGYDSYMDSLVCGEGLVIDEIMAANLSYFEQRGVGCSDWVRLRNTSDADIQLSDYYLSDNPDELSMWQFPEYSLSPGSSILVFCSGDESSSNADFIHTNFSLNAASDELYIFSPDTGICDFANIHHVPVNGSMGRIPGKNGFFYFSSPSQDSEKSGGMRRVSEKPSPAEPDGIFNNVDTVSVELQAKGNIYYTLDGSVPSLSSSPYTEPIELDSTSVLRCISVEDGALPSPPCTLNYIINEEHIFPVLSLVADDYGNFMSMYSRGRKYITMPATLSLYEEDGSFTQECGVSMKGWTSLNMPKRSMGVSFKSRFGDGHLNYDVFDNGIREYSSLSIRAGQDYPLAMIRNEMFQHLCSEFSDKVLIQQSKYCILYINGNYWGIYSLKEDFNRQYYSSNAGVSRDSVEMQKSPMWGGESLWTDVLQFCMYNDMSQPENYDYFTSVFDVDNLIDWIIMEGYCANTDVNGNMRYFRSSENDNKWRIAYYDMDWTFGNTGAAFTNIFNPSRYTQINPAILSLTENPDFREKLARRYNEAVNGVLSDEHVLQTIDDFQAYLEPEMPRERVRWYGDMDGWYYRLNQMRSFITDNDYADFTVDVLSSYLNLSEEEKAEFFS